MLRSMDAPAPTTLGTLFEEWPEIVGERMAKHVRPVRLRGTTLLLSVDEPGWAAQVRWMASELLGRLETGLGVGVVTSVEVRVDAGSQRP